MPVAGQPSPLPENSAAPGMVIQDGPNNADDLNDDKAQAKCDHQLINRPNHTATRIVVISINAPSKNRSMSIWQWQKETPCTVHFDQPGSQPIVGEVNEQTHEQQQHRVDKGFRPMVPPTILFLTLHRESNRSDCQ